MIPLDPKTFGKSKAAIHLATRLNQLGSDRIVRHVSNFLTPCNQVIIALSEMPNRTAMLRLGALMRDDINRRVIKDAPEIINSLARNVAIGALKARVFNADYDPNDNAIRASGDEFEFDQD